MTATDPIDLDAIRARADAATEGPWATGRDYEPGGLKAHELIFSPSYPLIEFEESEQGEADAEFVAHAREDVPALLAEVERLTAEQDALEDERAKARAEVIHMASSHAISRRQWLQYGEAVEAELAEARAERGAMLPVVEKVWAWREAQGEDHAVTSAELAGAWDAYTAGQPGADSGTSEADSASSVDAGPVSATDLMMVARASGGGIRSRDVQVPLEGDGICECRPDGRCEHNGITGPSVWALPDEPGPEVRAVRDRNGRRWTRRPELGRWECERKLAGLQVIESWDRLFRAAGPLTDATDEPAQDAARGTAGPDMGKETPDAPRGAETPDRDHCPPSQRIDGNLHSWKFDGDDPYIVCAYCGEMRDVLSGKILRPGFKDSTDA